MVQVASVEGEHFESRMAADGVVLASEADAGLLAKMGYKQELKRNFGLLEIFGISFSVMGLLPSIASTLEFSLPAGPAGMVWSWFLAGGSLFIVALAMADLGSAMPTSGGLYWWTHYFSSPKTRNFLCFLVGYSNTLGYLGGICSIDYGFSLMVLSIASLATDGSWTPPWGLVYVVFAVCVVAHGIMASMLHKIMAKLLSLSTFLNLALILVTVMALPIGVSRYTDDGSRRGLNDASFIFANFQNMSGWPAAWTFMMAWMSPIWTISTFDSCVHMSEEALNASRVVPMGILISAALAWGLGLIVVIVLAACINPNLQSVLKSATGSPMAQILLDSLGKNGALSLMVVVASVQFLMGLSIVVVGSRQMWAFSRDDALPFSSFLRRISKNFGHVPVRCVLTCTLSSLVMGLLTLVAPAAANALFSLGVAGNNLSWAIPIFSRVVWGGRRFVPGAFHTGVFSYPIAWASVASLVFGIILSMFPTEGPSPSPDKMNYTIIITAAVWGAASLYYYFSARHWFTGPKTTIDSLGDTWPMGLMETASDDSGLQSSDDGKGV